jgi:prepilin-type N-terminal cleavage/methylation domain-containing protein
LAGDGNAARRIGLFAPSGTALAFDHRMQATHRKHGIRRRAQRGFSLIEIVVAVAIIAMISAGITVAVINIALSNQEKLTRTNAETIRAAVKIWWATSNDVDTCPTVPMLIADGALDRGKSTKADAWGQPWKIQCDQNDATVVSRGRDKLPDTEDDIRVPPS